MKIPSSVTSIGIAAFNPGESLENVIFYGSAPSSIGANAFSFAAAGAKALVYASYLDSFGASGSDWYGLVLEEVPDPVPSVRFISPSNNTEVSRRLVTRYGMTDPEWASRMEVQVRGRGKTRWLSCDEVAGQHSLTRKIF